MNPVKELQRRTQKAGLGNPVYQSHRVGAGLASFVFVAGEPFSVFHTRGAKPGRRMVASCALFELFNFCLAIVIADRDPQIELMRWLPPDCLSRPDCLAVLFDTKCPICVVGTIPFPRSDRVLRCQSADELRDLIPLFRKP